MRFGLAFAALLLVGLLAAGVAWAFTANSVNIAKQNAYIIMTPPPQVEIAKENSYIVMSPPGQIEVAKENGYIVMSPPPQVEIVKENAYVVLYPLYPTGQISQ